MLKVALVGHSQLPHSLEVEGADIEIFRSPGGRAYSFYDDDDLNDVLNWSGDLAILWLGSNDIMQDTNVWEVVNDIIGIKESIEEETGATVVIILVEPRCYPDDEPVDEAQYRKIQKSINRKLERELSETEFIRFNLPLYEQELAEDGVHFTSYGKELIEEKISDCIESFVENHETDDSDVESDDRW